MLHQAFVILLAILPGVLICLYIYRSDRVQPEKQWHLLLSFLLGAVITVPGMFFQMWFDRLAIDTTFSLWMTLAFAFIIVALSEEILKVGAFLLYPFRQPFFDEPMDGIVYAVMIAMGFATVENIVYAVQYGIEITLVRALTAVPAHAVFGVFLGYYAGLGKFEIPRRKRQRVWLGFGWAVLLHGLYDFFILQEAYEWLILFGTATLYISAYFAFRLIRLHRMESRQRQARVTPVASVEVDSNTTELPPTDLTDEAGG